MKRGWMTKKNIKIKGYPASYDNYNKYINPPLTAIPIVQWHINKHLVRHSTTFSSILFQGENKQKKETISKEKTLRWANAEPSI